MREASYLQDIGIDRARRSGGVMWFGGSGPKESDRIIEWYKLEDGARKRLATFFTRADLQAGPQETAGDPLFGSGIPTQIQTTVKITPPDLRERYMS